ncbi:polymerase [Mesorhizobium humile]|uniref:Polymerase n=1 Tax=Mesorhizobium humile TaxID=3072313 RepID=A0ABU4YCF5_9HYPH|nr:MULTISPECIES: polymerase [unclassified Mesorhizobium]MDX8458849.1 polymerase [Mesorhizobium sp. VK2D]MDX8484632.1 polymerase [Mesorhizobium sp. VK2B]
MIRDALLACGVAMAYATQLDVPRLPFGYGELFLTLWIVLSLLRVLAGGRLEATPALAKLAAFWLVLTFALGLGTIVGFMTTVLYVDPLLHDTVAYALLICVTCLVAAEPDADVRLRRSAWWVIGIANMCFVIQVGVGWGWIHQSGVDPWYWDRFRGWSENPNQLAIYCALFGPLALHLTTTTRSRWGRLLGTSCLVITFYVGRLTKSDTYLYTSIATGLMFVALWTRTWLATGRADKSLFRQVMLLLLIGSLPLAMSLSPYALAEAGHAANYAKSLTKDKGGEATEETAALRLFLWGEALEKGATAGSLGLGPGPHLERPPIVDKQFLPRPFEAHSTVIDLYLQGGLVAVLALAWIVSSAALSAWRARADALLVLIASIVIFGSPHLIIRHPIVWFALTMSLVARTNQAVPATVRSKEY